MMLSVPFELESGDDERGMEIESVLPSSVCEIGGDIMDMAVTGIAAEDTTCNGGWIVFPAEDCNCFTSTRSW